MTESIVNRTAETAGQQIEKARLAAETTEKTAETSVWDTPAGQAALDAAVEKAAVDLGMAAAKEIDRKLVTSADAPVKTIAELSATPVDKPITPYFPIGDPLAKSNIDLTSVTGFLTSTGLGGSGGLLPALVADRGNPDQEFRDKVISAFKHLGLDVKKHFGV